MHRLACSVGFALLTVLAPLAAQDVTLPLARVINREIRIEFPLHPCGAGSAVMAIARDVNVPAGIEYLPDCSWDRPHTYDPSIEPLLLGTLTVEQAMTRLVAAAPRYRWAMSDGVLVMRPVMAWADRDHFLNQSAGTFGFEEQNMHGALHHLKLAFEQRSGSFLGETPGRTPQGDQKFSIKRKPTSLIGALDAVVRAHGAMQWEIMYCRPEVRVVNAKLSLWTTDRSGIGAPFYAVDADGRRFSGCVPASQ